MVKAPMEKKSRGDEKRGRPATHAEIKAAIQEAIDLLDIKPENKESFSPLAAQVGVASSTLYGAYRGDHGLGPGSLNSVRQFIARIHDLHSIPKDVPISHDLRRAKAAVDYVLTNGDRAQVSIFLAMIHASEQEVSARNKQSDAASGDQ